MSTNPRFVFTAERVSLSGCDMDIKIIDIRLLRDSKSVKGFADLLIDGITIRDFRIYQTNGKPALRNPCNTYREQTGALKFREIVSLPPTVQAEVNALVLNAYFRRLKEQSHERPQ